MFGVFEFCAAFFFNIKIKMINRKKYNTAALLGAIATTLFMVLTMVAPLVADGSGFWFIFAGAGMMAIGNIIATLALIPFEKWYKAKVENKGVQ